MSKTIDKWDKQMSTFYNETFKEVFKTKTIDSKRRISIAILVTIMLVMSLSLTYKKIELSWVILQLLFFLVFYFFLVFVDSNPNYLDAKREKVALDIIKGLSKEKAQGFIRELDHRSQRWELLPIRKNFEKLLTAGIFSALFTVALDAVSKNKTSLGDYLLGVSLLIIVIIVLCYSFNLFAEKVIAFFRPAYQIRQLIYHLLIMEEPCLPSKQSQNQN